MTLNDLINKAKDYKISDDDNYNSEKNRLSFVEKFPIENIIDLNIEQYAQGTDDNSFCFWLEHRRPHILFGIGGSSAKKFGIYKSQKIGGYTNLDLAEEPLKGEELDKLFLSLKNQIIKALEYTRKDQISLIKSIDTPIFPMVLQKILSIYYPNKFLTIGASKVLIECAKDIGLKGVDLDPKNLIEINYELKKLLTNNEIFNDWSYNKLGSFIYSVYKSEIDKEYYIIGSKYGVNNDKDVFPLMLKNEVVSVGFASEINLEDYYGKKHDEIINFLKTKGENQSSYSTLKYFLNLKPGDQIAVKGSGSPKGKLAYLSILAIAEVEERNGKVYTYDPDSLVHQINVKFLKAPLNEEFNYGFGKTIHKLRRKTHYDKIKSIFKSDVKILENYSLKLNYRVEFKNWLKDESNIKLTTINSYIKSIDILSSIEKNEIFTIDDENYLKVLYDDLINNQRNESSRFYDPSRPSYSLKGFYSAAIKEYSQFIHMKKAKNMFKKQNSLFPINKILFGPPGTGKTFKLNEIAQNYTVEIKSSESVKSLYENRRKNFKFDMLGLEKGTILTFEKDENQKCIVIDNYRVEFRGEATTLSASALILLNEMGYSTTSTQGPSRWCYQGIPLNTLRNQIESTIVDKNNMMKKKNYTFVTFHQSFSYEDFIEGIKPIMDSDELKYEVRDGVFKDICNRASEDKDGNRYAIFIDEINRGNVSSIFGELITLIETDKRENAENAMSIILPYSQKSFSVPNNLDIYGTMNTADRSVEALDTALRRRFIFEELPPLDEYVTDNIKGLDINIKNLFNTINKRIEMLIDKDHMIGHSYFMNLNSTFDLKNTFQNKVIPLLQEYFFGDFGKIGLVLGEGFVVKENNSDSLVFAKFSDYDDGLLSEKEIYRLIDVTKIDDEKFEDVLNQLFN